LDLDETANFDPLREEAVELLLGLQNAQPPNNGTNAQQDDDMDIEGETDEARRMRAIDRFKRNRMKRSDRDDMNPKTEEEFTKQELEKELAEIIADTASVNKAPLAAAKRRSDEEMRKAAVAQRAAAAAAQRDAAAAQRAASRQSAADVENADQGNRSPSADADMDMEVDENNPQGGRENPQRRTQPANARKRQDRVTSDDEDEIYDNNVDDYGKYRPGDYDYSKCYGYCKNEDCRIKRLIPKHHKINRGYFLCNEIGEVCCRIKRGDKTSMYPITPTRILEREPKPTSFLTQPAGSSGAGRNQWIRTNNAGVRLTADGELEHRPENNNTDDDFKHNDRGWTPDE
jgi:hypothetical protein